MFCAKYQKHHAIEKKPTLQTRMHHTWILLFANDPRMMLEDISIHALRAAAISRIHSPVREKFGLTRNKRGERSVRVYSWRKDKIGVVGRDHFRQDFRRFADPVFSLATRSRAGCDSAKREDTGNGQSKTHDRDTKGKKRKEQPRRCRQPRRNTWFVQRDESADRVIRCRTELYLLYGTFMAPIKIRSALPVGHYRAGGRGYFRAIDEADTSRA